MAADMTGFDIEKAALNEVDKRDRRGVLTFLANRWPARESAAPQLLLTQSRSMSANELTGLMYKSEVMMGQLFREHQTHPLAEEKVDNPYLVRPRTDPHVKRLMMEELLRDMKEEGLISEGPGPAKPSHFFITRQGAAYIGDQVLVEEFDRLAGVELPGVRTALRQAMQRRKTESRAR